MQHRFLLPIIPPEPVPTTTSLLNGNDGYGSLVLSSIMTIMQTSTNNASSTTNTTHESLVKTIPQMAETVGSITNSILFIIIYSVLLLCILAFYIKSRKQMKRNQVILFILVGICIIVQYLGLVFRLIYHGTALHINISYTDFTLITNLSQLRIVFYVSATLENALVLSQVIHIIIVTCFIQNMFLRTVENAGAMSRKLFKVLKYLINIVSALFAIVMTPLILLNAAINLATKMQLVKFDVTPIVVIIIIAFVVVVFGQLLIFLMLGVRLLMVVKKNSLKISQMKQNEQQSLKQLLQRPYSKIVGLMLGILLSSLLQFVAGIVSFITSSYFSGGHIIDYFLQCLGILLFAVFVLLVYNPLVLSHNGNAVQQQQNEEPPSQISSARQQPPSSSSARRKTGEFHKLQQTGAELHTLSEKENSSSTISIPPSASVPSVVETVQHDDQQQEQQPQQHKEEEPNQEVLNSQV